MSFLRGRASGVTAALVLGIALIALRAPTETTLTPIAQLRRCAKRRASVRIRNVMHVLAAEGVKPTQLAGWIGLAGAYEFLPIENPEVKPVFFHPNSPPESQPIRYVAASAPRTFLGAAPVDDLINPERNTRQMAAQLQSAGVPVTVQFYPRTSHMTLIGAFAAPLRFLAPVLEDVVEFVKTAPPR